MWWNDTTSSATTATACHLLVYDAGWAVGDEYVERRFPQNMQIIIARGGRYLIVLKVSSARAKCPGRQMQKVLSSTSISLSSRAEGWWCQRYYCRSRVQNQVRRSVVWKRIGGCNCTSESATDGCTQWHGRVWQERRHRRYCRYIVIVVWWGMGDGVPWPALMLPLPLCRCSITTIKRPSLTMCKDWDKQLISLWVPTEYTSLLTLACKHMTENVHVRM